MHVVATAGHVDHGKSTLVRALTGMEPDRWAEEHRRGMTIDLGYAWTDLPSGEQLAFVDVPGHQRFIANMLAGLGPTPAVLFVVAADEGWSRQSEEHLAALDALGRAARAARGHPQRPGRPGPALAEARERLAAHEPRGARRRRRLGDDRRRAWTTSGAPSTGWSPACPVPTATPGCGCGSTAASPCAGSGTVVTGTLSAGSLRVGDTLELHGRPVSVRGLQSTGTAHDHVDAVARVALNLRGVKQPEVGRGDVLLTPRRVAPHVLARRPAEHGRTAAGRARTAPRDGGRAGAGAPARRLRWPG